MHTRTMLASTILVLGLLSLTEGAPEQGKFKTVLVGGNEFAFFKTLYKGSTVKITVVKKKDCTIEDADLQLRWLLRSSTCYAEYNSLPAGADRYMKEPYVRLLPGGKGYYLTNGHDGETVDCSVPAVRLRDLTNATWIPFPDETPTVSPTSDKEEPTAKSRKRREDKEKKVTNSTKQDESNPPQNSPETVKDKNEKPSPNTEPSDISTEANEKAVNKAIKEGSLPALTSETSPNHVVAVVPVEAPYILVIRIEGDGNFSYEVSVEMKSPKGFLSAHQYPLLTFYMIMCIIYALYATAWLIMSACNFRDLLRVQFWIGGVILLGMIEKAVFYSEYLSVNTTGESVPGAAKFAEVVSALKRSLARMLVIIVSLGFGIVKPRLGPMLHRVIGIGMLYFILAVIEALVRSDAHVNDLTSSTMLFATIPLAVLDAIICWWIFMSLMQTMKTLRLRRNVVKLSLYRHFSNTIIFCIIASFVMIFWSNHHDICISDWRELWINDAFWHILFSVILLVIMVLWRPNINNQRYAFSPLIDEGDEDDDVEEPMLGGGATESVKMRGLKNANDHQASNKAEDDLKWIEENIPQTVADAALPAIMDSDEEVMTTKYEMSKME